MKKWCQCLQSRSQNPLPPASNLRANQFHAPILSCYRRIPWSFNATQLRELVKQFHHFIQIFLPNLILQIRTQLLKPIQTLNHRVSLHSTTLSWNARDNPCNQHTFIKITRLDFDFFIPISFFLAYFPGNQTDQWDRRLGELGFG